MEEELREELLEDRFYIHANGGCVESKPKKKPPQQKDVKTFNELFAPLDEVIQDSEDLDSEPVSATVSSAHLAVALTAYAPVVATTTTSATAAAFSVDAAADPSGAGGGGGDAELDLDDDLCSPVAVAASQILDPNVESDLAAEDCAELPFSSDNDDVDVE